MIVLIFGLLDVCCMSAFVGAPCLEVMATGRLINTHSMPTRPKKNRATVPPGAEHLAEGQDWHANRALIGVL